MAKFYGAGQWDPKLIVLQIICLQCSFYISQGVLLFLCHGFSLTFDDFFAYYAQNLSNVEGIKNSFSVIASSVISAIALSVFVERAKKCLDFGITLYFVDLIIHSIYLDFPRSWEWWIVHVIALAITVLLGEYLCSRQELQDIPMLKLFSK
ncbi:hypothetical protein ABG067_000638 [Albugo candida]